MSQSVHLPLAVAITVAVLAIASLAFAGAVWQRRRRAATDRRRRPGQIASFVSLVAAALLLVVSGAFHLFTRRVGNLQAHDLFVVYSQPDMGVPRFVDDTDRTLAPGDVLLHFDRPAGEAELRAMELELQAIENERDRVRIRALDIDPELSRERARLDADHRLLIQRRQTARLALGLGETQVRMEVLGHQTRLHEVSTEIERVRGRLATNRSELTYATALADSHTDLERQRLVAPLEAQHDVCNVEALSSQAEQMAGEHRRQEQLERELRTGVVALQARLDRHHDEVELELATVDADIAHLGERRTQLETAIRADRSRVDGLRAAELREQDCRARALAMRLEQRREELRVLAPVAGRVLYRHPAPAATPARAPILAFGAVHSVRAHLKLSRAEADRIARSGPVWLHANDELDEPFFTGTFLGVRDVRAEPGVALVELSCEPGDDVIRELIGASRLAVELDWAPPIYLDPVVGLALILLACHLFFRVRPLWTGRVHAGAQPVTRAITRDPSTT